MPPGPPPKNPATRQRRNKASTAAEIRPGRSTRKKTPTLYHRSGGWHQMTRLWWADIWKSPLEPEYLQADVHTLYMLAELVDRFWRSPSVDLAKEIRLQGQRFGLAPLDRRRLEWTKRDVPAGSDKPALATPTKRRKAAADPRRGLHAVQ